MYFEQSSMTVKNGTEGKKQRHCFRHLPQAFAALILMFSLMLPTLLLSGCSRGETQTITLPEPQVSFEMTPIKKADGSPFHIAFMDLQPPIESSYLCLKGFAEGLQSAGYLPEELDFDAAPARFYSFYNYLVSQDLGDYVVFDEKPYVIDEDNEEIADTLRKKAGAGELDIIVSTGTSCGRFLKSLELPIPFLVCLATDPIASGIIKSSEADGSENIWALVEPNPYGRQFEAYHRVLGFEKVLLVRVEEYADFDGSEQYLSAAEGLEVTCDELIVKEDDALSEGYSEVITDLLKKKNFKNYDAVLFALESIADENAPAVADLLGSAGVPFLIGDGDSLVKNGGLMILSCFDYEGYGKYAAGVVSNIFHGQEAGRQPRVYTSSPYLLLNMTTAIKTGFETDYELLRSADKIYR